MYLAHTFKTVRTRSIYKKINTKEENKLEELVL